MNQSKLAAIQKELDALDRDEKIELARRLLDASFSTHDFGGEVDLNIYAGTAHLPVDGLAWQRSLRSEWDR